MKNAILTGLIGALTLITGPTAFAGPAAGVYVRFVPYGAGAASVAGPCPVASALVAEQNQVSKWPTWHQAQAASLDVEQVLNIGSATAGAGAGRVTFNPLTLTLVPSSLDSTFLERAALGTPFCQVDVLTVGSAGPTQLFTLRLAALKKLGWNTEKGGNTVSTYTLEYGGFLLSTQAYKPDGTIKSTTAKGWNRVQNTTLAPTAGEPTLDKLMP